MPTPRTDAALDTVRTAIEQADTLPTLADLAHAAGLSPTHLQRAFRRRFGMSPAEYHRARRFGQLRQALREGNPVSDAVYGAGFGSGSRVYEHSDRLLGMTPASYRAGGDGASIRYTVTGTPLGPMLVACTTRGLCAVTLADDEADDSFGEAVADRPGDGGDVVRAGRRPQMHLHFLQLDTVAEDFYLVVDPAEVMEQPVLVLHP